MRWILLMTVFFFLVTALPFANAQDDATQGYWELVDVVPNPDGEELVDRTCVAARRECTEKSATAGAGSVSLHSRRWSYDDEEDNITGTSIDATATMTISAPQVFEVGEYTQTITDATATFSQGGELFFATVYSDRSTLTEALLGLAPDFPQSASYSGPITIGPGREVGETFVLGFRVGANYAPNARVDYVYQWNEGDPDADGDGIQGRADGCPEDAGSATNFGCPDSVTDIDFDDLHGNDDPCPLDPDNLCQPAAQAAPNLESALAEMVEDNADGNRTREDVAMGMLWALPLATLANDGTTSQEAFESLIAQGYGDVTFGEIATRLQEFGVDGSHPQWGWVFGMPPEFETVTLEEWLTFLKRGED